MEQEPEVYIIPANVTDNGNVINGNIKKKNAYEAGVIAVAGLIFSLLILGFLPLIVKIIILMLFFMLACLAIVGIKGESLFEAVLENFFFKKKMRVMKYRLPRKDIEPKEKKLKFDRTRKKEGKEK